MDPTTALHNFLVACRQKNRDEALEAIDALHDWLLRDGFLPQVYRPWEAPHTHKLYVFTVTSSTDSKPAQP